MKEPETEHVYFTRKECNGFCLFIGVCGILCSALLYLTTKTRDVLLPGFFLGIALGAMLSIRKLWHMSIQRLIALFPAQKPLIDAYDQKGLMFLHDMLIPRNIVETVTQGDPRRDAILQEHDMVLAYIQGWKRICIVLTIVIVFIEPFFH